MISLKEKALKAFFWDFIGKLFTRGVGFIITIFLARLLEPSDFGLIAMIMVVIGMAQVFTDVGLGGALIQRRKVLPIHYSSVFYVNIATASLLTCITYFSADFIAEFYDNQDLIPLTQVVSVLFIIGAFSSVQATRLRKQLDYARLAKVSFISSLLSGIVGVSCAFNGAGAWSLIAQVISQGVFYNLTIWRASTWKPSFSFSVKALKQLWGFGFRFFLSNLIASIFSRIDLLIIGKVFPAATLGYFQRAKQFNTLVIEYSSGSLMAVMFPILSEIQNDLPRFKSVILKSLNVLCLLVFLLLGIVYLTSEEMIIFLFSEKWLPSVNYMEILILSGFGYPISSLLVNVLSSRGNSKAFLKLEVIKKSLHILNLLNAYFNGIEIYLYGLVVVTFCNVSLNVIFAHKEIHIPILSFLKVILTQMGISIICVLTTLQAVYWVDAGILLIFVLKIFFFLAVFFSINVIFHTDSYTEIKRLVLPVIKTKLRV